MLIPGSMDSISTFLTEIFSLFDRQSLIELIRQFQTIEFWVYELIVLICSLPSISFLKNFISHVSLSYYFPSQKKGAKLLISLLQSKFLTEIYFTILKGQKLFWMSSKIKQTIKVLFSILASLKYDLSRSSMLERIVRL